MKPAEVIEAQSLLMHRKYILKKIQQPLKVTGQEYVYLLDVFPEDDLKLMEINKELEKKICVLIAAEYRTYLGKVEDRLEELGVLKDEPQPA